jgi:predicted polyphosphate/ATP-dependent NAD kinase
MNKPPSRLEGEQMPLVGIIANPASGKDIRRLVAHGSVFDNQEKVRIVRRLLTGLAATGVDRVCFMPDYYGIVPRALRELDLDMKVFPANFKPYGNQDDTVKAAGIMAERGVCCIITLGGDGTNRAVVKGARNLPILPISTGTNNVFPDMVEGTIAGLAAGLVTTGKVDIQDAAYHSTLLEVLVEGEPKDIALVDAASCDERFIGSRAVWDMSKIRQIFLNRAQPDSIGLSSIGGLLENLEPDQPRAMRIDLGPGGSVLMAPVAPGVMSRLEIQEMGFITPDELAPVKLNPCVMALDGERELEIPAGKKAEVRVSLDGPMVIEVKRAMAAAQKNGVFSV